MIAQNQIEPLMVGIPEAAAILNVSRQTVKRMIVRGDIQATKVGLQWRINRRALLTLAGEIEETEKPQTK